MGFNISQGGVVWKNGPGKGRWKFCQLKAGSPTWSFGSSTQLTIPNSIETGLRNQGRRGAALALGIRIRGSVACDNTGGATTTYAQKVHLLACFKVLVTNGFVQAYFQKEITLAQLFFAGQIVNLPVTMLDREFNSDQPVGTAAPKRTRFPERFVIEDTLTSSMTPIGAFDTSVWPTTSDPRSYKDSFWRVFEDRFLIRQATAATNALDILVPMPLCAFHLGATGLEKDSLPLALLANQDKPWTVQITYDQDPTNRLIGFNGGSITITAFELWVYVVPMKDSDPLYLGRTWYMRFESFASPYKLLAGELPLAIYNAPADRSAETYAVDAVDYIPGVEYPNIGPDFTVGNQVKWYGSDGISNFPDDLDDLNPRNVYERMWNMGSARPNIHTGLSSQVMVFSGTAVTGTRGYTTQAVASFDTMLGTVSSAPIRVQSCLLIDVEGVPGLASQDSNCQRPYVEYAGTGFDYTSSALSSMLNVTVIGLNNSPQDIGVMKDLAATCCNRPNVNWQRMKLGGNVKAEMVADLVGGWMEAKGADAPPAPPVATK